MKTKLSVFCEKIIEAGWLAALVTVPLFFNIYSARTFEPDKIALLRTIALVMSLSWIVMVIEQGSTSGSAGDPELTPTNRFRLWIKTPLVLPTTLLVVVYLISTIFSISPHVSFWGSYQRLQGTYSALSYITVFALMAATLRTREQVDRLITVVIVTSIPVSLYGIVQRYGLDPLPWAGDVTTRVASSLGNAIFVASYLIMVIPLTIVRLVESMTAIVKEEEASWGYTILAAIYIFALAVQTLTVIFSQSRGPMLGVLGAVFVMGLVILLILRQLHSDPTRLSLSEIGSGIVFVAPLILVSLIAGGVGYGIGLGVENLLLGLGYQIENVTLLGILFGGLLGFLGTYTFMAATNRSWRWLWLSWLGVSFVAILFVLILNLQDTAFDPYLASIRQTPYINRLANITQTESGTGRVRVLIWDASLKLVGLHDPLGIPNDDLVGQDPFNVVRPLIGYGPESMFNAFAFVYPPELAHVENRGSSADRSHNETVDSLVITGLVGFLMFYFLMISLFYYILKWLSWVPDSSASRRLVVILSLSGILGAVAAFVADGDLTFVPLGLPFGLISGVILYVIWQGMVEQRGDRSINIGYSLTLIGLLGAIIGHFIEVHFVFSIAATYTYFWAYAGVMLALSKIMQLDSAPSNEEATEESEGETETPSPANDKKRSKRARGRRTSRRRNLAAGGSRFGFSYGGLRFRESWEAVIGAQGLAMAIILMIITFNFITPQFTFTLGDNDSMSLLWMLTITWLIGLGIALSDVAVRQDDWPTPVNWGRAAALFIIPSLSYFFFHYLAHTIQLGQRIVVNEASDVIRAADVLVNSLVIFYIFLLILIALFAIMLGWRQMRQLSLWRVENWWLYPPLVLAIVVVIWFKNINVVRADIYLKEGDRYRSGNQWDQAIALHEKARSLDSDEDFYYLMLALDYQLMAQDNRLDPAIRDKAWKQGEEIALEARRINPYNPDNTGNMGRYYFTLGQIFDKEKFNDALDFFERATVLAPSNVIYHNLWAQTYYILGNYEEAIERLKVSVEIDPRYPPTWVLLGDTYAALGDIDSALDAHTRGMELVVRGSDGFGVFADQFLDQRLNFYISAGRVEDIVAAMQAVATERPDDARVQWAIGHTFSLAGQYDQALPYLEQALALGDRSARTLKELANIYLTTEALDQARPLYEAILQSTSDVEAHSALAFIYARQGNLDRAIEQNQLVLQQIPNDYDSLKNLAIIYRDKAEFQQALDFARQAQTAAPEGEAASWDQFIAEIENQLANAG